MTEPSSYPFTDRTLVISGASRGIGLAIALGAARRGANIVLLAKTAEPHPKLPGTVHTAVAEIEAAGGKGVAVVGDVRNEEDVARAIDTAVERFGGVDIAVNNASAIATEPTEKLAAKKFDLMMDINVRGTFLLTKAALPHLRQVAGRPRADVGAADEHEPLLAGRAPVLHAVEIRDDAALARLGRRILRRGIGFSCLWPETYIATSAVTNLADGDKLAARSRDPQIMGDAAVEIFSRPPAEVNGQCYIDSQVLTEAGVTDLSRYGGGDDPILDIFVDKS